MTSSDTHNTKPRASWIRILLFLAGLSLLSAVGARAQSVGGCVANFGGVIDGFVNPVPPSQINIDGNCTIRNFPASNPLTSNISFTGTGRGWLVIFDNVDFIGNLSCDKSHGNFIWFVNGSITRQHILNCSNLFAPVDKIDKENPPGPPFVSIGVPFTYTLTFPQLVSATTGAVVNPNGSNTEVDQVTVTDNLNATGASLSYVKSSAAWKGSGAPVPFTVTNASGLLTFSGFPAIPAGQQIVLSVTVVLNNAVPPNSPGTQFSNMANWTLGTTIGGTFHYPLPGQQGISSPPLTIAAPSLVMTKGGPSTMNPGQLGQFTLNVQNTGNSDAWNATIVDKLPTGTTGGMCTATPQILSAQVFQADGVTPVPGKGAFVAGTDYTLTYAGAPACTLTLNLLSAAAVISPTQRLIVTYQTKLDANTPMGATLTNVAGATQWYNGPSSDTGRQSYTCTLTNGTPGLLDCQDAHTVTVTAAAVTITKQVTVVGGGAAAPGATLDYLVHVTNASANPASPVVITDDLNAAGAGALTYVSGTATMNGSVTGVTVTANVITADYSAIYGALAPGGTIDLRFRATVSRTLATGTTVTNTGVVTWNNPPQSVSASVSVQLDTPPGALTVSKTTPLVDVTRGQLVPYTITVTNVLTGPVLGVALVDSFPAGFRYIQGSARLDDVPAEPTVSGFQLTWSNLSFAGGAHHTIVLLLAVGAGVGEGEFVNRAQAFAEVGAAALSRAPAAPPGARTPTRRIQAPAAILGGPVSTEGTATVRVVPDVTFDCTDVLGKVFDDANGNGQQDPGEQGLPGVRVLTTRGLAAITDEFGRFHISCAITPLEGRGSNFALKLDDRTLPSGYRLTTPQVLVERATRGKDLRFEFGASIHRVVSLDLSDAAFEPGTTDIRLQWRPRLDLLLAELRKSRSVLHLSYLADIEDKQLVDRRLEAVDRAITDAWRALNCCYELTIEREVFWLRGSPPKEPVERLRGAP